jgi:hypothetical protein
LNDVQRLNGKVLGGKAMLYEPSMAHELAKERVKDIRREAIRAGSGRAAESREKSLKRRPLMSVFKGLLPIFGQRRVGY